MPKRLLTALAALVGVALFAYAVQRVGVDQIAGGLRRVGWGLIPILALGGLRFLARAEAWRLCTPPHARLSLRQTFIAFLAGDALGNVTPLGLIASESTKVLLTRHHLATKESVASLAVDNLLYAASVVAVIVLAIGVAVASLPLSRVAEEWGVVTALALIGLCVVVLAVLRSSHLRRLGPSRVGARLAAVRVAVLEFSAGHPGRLWRAFAFDMAFHALAVLETFLTLWWLLGAHRPTFTQALIFEALNRVINVVFKFVPFRFGIDEASSGALAPLLAVASVAGVSLAVIRKVRNLCWAAVGLAFIGAHHARTAPAPDRP